MGLDHEKLTYFHQGRDERLTDVYGDGGEGHPGLNARRSGDVTRRVSTPSKQPPVETGG